MRLRENRTRGQRSAWLIALAIACLVGLWNQAFLWLPVLMCLPPAAQVAVMWGLVRQARRRTLRSGQVWMVAATRRAAVRAPEGGERVSWADETITGWLRVVPDGWVWQPTRATADEFHPIDLTRALISGVSWLDSPPQLLMPSARYLRVTMRNRGQVEFLIWDPDRLPPMEPHP
jgi:hypothetical protein